MQTNYLSFAAKQKYTVVYKACNAGGTWNLLEGDLLCDGLVGGQGISLGERYEDPCFDGVR